MALSADLSPCSSNTRAKARACGKIILLGEHFVVPHEGSEGAPAIALPLLALSCEVEVTRSLDSGVTCIAEGARDDRASIEGKMGVAVNAALAALQVEPRGLVVRSRATFPLSRGFGSSAAFSVALTRALDALEHEPASEGVSVRDLGVVTHAVERVFHGAPSGLDTAVILAERAIRFHRGRPVRFVPHFGVDLVAIDSGPRAAAAPLIARVKALRASQPSLWSRLATRMTEIVDRCEAALAAGQSAIVGELASEAHRILEQLGLTDGRIEHVLEDGRALGALGGKVSGSGAGGAVVLVARHGDGQRLASALGARGHSVVAVNSSRSSSSSLRIRP